MGVVLTSYSQTYLLQEDFEDTYAGWTIASYSGNDWDLYNASTFAHSGNIVAGYEYNASEAADAYFFFQPLYLDAGTTYDVSFWQRVYDSSYPEKFELTVGTTNAGSSQSTVHDWSSQTNSNYVERTTTYTPTTSGIYYFAIHCYSDADEAYLFFDDVSVSTNNCKDHSCLAATNISSLPYSGSGLTTCGNCNNYNSTDACGSIFMDGPEYVFTYTPSSDGWVDVQLTTPQDGLRNGASVFLLDNCPSSGANCLASSTVQYPANHGAPHVNFNMVAGQQYYIVVANDPQTTDFTNSCIYFDIDVTNISQPNPSEEDCFGAQPICGDTWHESSPGNGQGAYPSEVNSSTSCLEGERNGTWYSFTVESSGTIKILIDPDYAGTNGDSNDNADDYDFSLYNVTNAGCEGIFDGSSPEVACNYQMVVDGETGNTGVNSDSSSAAFESDVLVNAGETYMLYISQWSVSTHGFTITLGGTADYIDNDGPELTSVDQPNCAQNEVIVHFSENIDCSSYSASDFTLGNPGGSSLTVTGVSSDICDAGGSFTENVTLTLSGNITIGGTYTIGLVDGSISDQCGHNNANGSPTVSFTIVTPNVVAESTSPKCVGQTLSLHDTGNGSDTWSWTGPNSFTSTLQNPNISNVQTSNAGTYYVTGTITSTGCTSTSPVNVTINPLPNVNPISNTDKCVGETLTLNENAGDATSWVWTSNTTWNPNDVQNPSLSNAQTSATGRYTVSVTDANNCSNSAYVDVVVNPLPSVTANADANPVCEGSAVTLTGGGADTYTWTNGVSNGTPFVQAVGTTNYTVTGTATSTGCTNTDNISVTVNPAATVDAGADAQICADETYTLSGSFGGGASSVLWTTSGDGSFNDATSPTAVYTPGTNDIPAVGASSNTITLTLTTNDPAGPCGSESDNMILTINPMEDASFSYSSGTFCETATNPTPTISGVSGGTFSGSAGLVINSSTGEIDLSGTGVGGPYTVTYTTPGTCSSNSQVSITITAGFDAEFYYDTPVCNSGTNPLPQHNTGSDGVYSSTSGLNFVNTSTGEIDFSTTTPGTYTVTNTIAANGGCSEDVANFDITIDEAAEVFAGNDITLCESDGSYVLSEATMGGSATSVVWSTTGNGSISNGSNINATYNFSGDEVVTLVVTTNDPGTSCNAISDNIVLTINDAAEVDAGANAAICADETYTLSGTSGGSTSNITWSTSGDGTFNDNTSLNAVYTPGVNDKNNGFVTLTLSSDNPTGPCGVVSSNMTLTINPLPTVIATSNSPVCVGSVLDLSEAGGDADNWVWTSNTTYNPADIQNPSQANVSSTMAGQYTVIGTISSTGCFAEDVVTVNVNPLPTVIATSNSSLCDGETLNLSETGGEANNWVWTSNTTYNPDDIQSPIHTSSIPSESGDYTVTGTITATGCYATSTVTVVINSLPSIVANADDNTVCEGTSVTLTGSGADSYVWNNGVTNGVSFVPSVGTTNYEVTGTSSATGCYNTDNIDITVNPMPTVDAGTDASICENATYQLNGSIGGGATTASWSTLGDGSFDNFNSLNAIYTPGTNDILSGSVNLILTTDDPAGDCDAVSSTMTLSITDLDDAQFSYPSGTFCVTGSNPIPDVINTPGGTFSGSTGLVFVSTTTGEIDMALTGTGGPFTVTYTTNGTCPNSSTFDITITSGFDAEFSYDTPVCSDITNPLPSHNTGSNGNYTETTGNLSFVNTGTGEIDLANTIPGSYTITNTIAANGGCAEAHYTFDIIINESAQVFAGNNNIVCASDSSYTFTDASFGGSATSVTWICNGDSTFVDSSIINATYTFAPSDIGQTLTFVVITDDPGLPCGVKTDTVEITINPAAFVDAGTDASICANETYTLNGAIGGATQNVTWSTLGDGTFNDENILAPIYTPGVNDKANGSVSLKLISNDPSGPCNADSSVMVLTINALPILDIQSNSPICEGNQLTLSENGGDANQWNWTSTTTYDPDNIQNPVYDNVITALTGIYTVVATDTVTGCSNSGDISVIVNSNPVAFAGTDQTIPAGTSTTINDAAPNGYSYSWLPANLLVNDTVLHPQTETLQNTTNFILTVTEPITGCYSTDTVTINIIGCHLELNATSNVNCYGDSTGSIHVTLESAVPNYDYTLYLDTNIVETLNDIADSSIVFSNLIAGNYSIQAVDNSGCNSSISDIILTSNPEIIIKVDNENVLCWNQNTGNAQLSVTGGVSPIQYVWEDTVNIISNEVNIDSLHAGTYFYTITDAVGCTGNGSVTIMEPSSELTVNVENISNSNCYNDSTGSISLLAEGGTPDYTYLWSNGETILNLTNITAGNYTLTLTDANNCTDTISAEVLNPTQLLLSDSVKEIDYSGFIYLYPSGGTEPYSYIWNNDVTTSTNEYLSSGDYYVTVTDANGCTIINNYTIKIPLIVPTVITPNGDGKNDYFNITNVETLEKVKINVFNRWGDLIFTFDDAGSKYKEQSSQWDGTDLNGHELPIGSYVYIIEIEGKVDTYRGTVTIIK